MKMNFKIFGLMLLMVLAVLPAINAQSYATINDIRINGHTPSTLSVQRGEEITVEFLVTAENMSLNNVYAEGSLSGFRQAYYVRDEVTDFSKTFNLNAGDSKAVTMTFKVPMDMEMKYVKLRLIVYDENSASVIVENLQLSVYGAEDDSAVAIRDFLISPSTTVMAGSALSFKVKVKNYADYDIDDVTVKVAIPELDVQDVETIDTIEPTETQSFEALYIRIPAGTAPGDYEVVATVDYDNYQCTEVKKTIKVIAATGTPCSGANCGGNTGGNTGGESSKTIVTMPASVDVVKGTQGSVYPILVENKGTTQKTYVLSVSGVDFGTAVFEPSSVFQIAAGQSQTVYLRLTPSSSAQTGDKVMKVTITAGNEVKDTTVIASVKEGATPAKTSNTNLKKVLEWFIVILVIILVVLGLILAFRRLRKGNGEEEEQSYY